MAQPGAPTPSLEQFVRDDVIDGLMAEGFTREQAETGVTCGSGVTFSQLFTSSLNWLMLQRGHARPMTAIRKDSPVQTQTVSSAKPNGHAMANVRTCKCGCGGVVPEENRFSYINGHRTRKVAKVAKVATTQKCACGRELGHTGRHKGVKPPPAIVPSAPPPVAARVSLEVTEAQLNQFLVRLSLADKQRLANHFLSAVSD